MKSWLALLGGDRIPAGGLTSPAWGIRQKEGMMLDKLELFLFHYKELVTAVLAIVSPSIAALALIFGFRLELEKRRAQDDGDRRKQAEAVLGEVYYATSTTKLIAYANSSPTAEQSEALQKAFERIMDKLMAQSGLGDQFRDNVRFVNPGATDRLFVLLAEARLRIAKANVTTQDIVVVYLALLTLSYLYQTEPQRQNDDTYAALEALCASSPTYTILLIDKDTPSLRINPR
jgi:hypothetical protein